MLPVQSSSINSIAYSSNGVMMAVGSTNGPCVLWNIKELEHRKLGKVTMVSCVRFSSDCKYLACASLLKAVYVYDINADSIRVISKPSGVLSLGFSPNSSSLAVGSKDRSIRVIDLVTGEEQQLYGHSYSVSSVMYSYNGEFIVSASLDKTVKVWSAYFRKKIKREIA